MKTQDILILSPQEITALLSIDECIIAVEEAFGILGQGKVQTPAVLSMHVPGGGFHVKAGILNRAQSYFAAKVNGNFPENPAHFQLPTIQGVIVLCDAERGSPLAVMDSRAITSLRTAAATAVAAKHLARADARTLTICGCGQQGYVQALAIARVRRLEQVFVFDKIPEHAEHLAQRLTSELQIPVSVMADLPYAARQSDISVTCTTSRQPVLGPDDVAAGTFIAAVGADNPEKQELHPALMAKSKIVADIVEQCAVMGDLHHAIVAGVLTRTDVHAELGEIVAGRKPGRESAEEITIFDSTGMALQDVATAAFLYEKAQCHGAGVRLDFAA